MRSVDTSPSRPPRARDALRGAGLERLDAEVLLAHVLGVDRAALHLDDPPLSVEAAARFASLAHRRRRGEPVAYLTGRKGFRWLELLVDPRVLIPRPETEHLVEAALALPAHHRVVDVGTGSGAVALALASERPDLRVVGVDISADALDVARANGARLGVAVEWQHGDGLAPVNGEIDAVVANLPYVAAGEAVAEGVRHEPPEAVWGGTDGLDVVRRLVAQAGALGPVPFLALEVGATQAAPVAALARGAGYARVDVRADLAGLPRVVVARR